VLSRQGHQILALCAFQVGGWVGGWIGRWVGWVRWNGLVLKGWGGPSRVCSPHAPLHRL
jgi:hypothetical protein